MPIESQNNANLFESNNLKALKFIQDITLHADEVQKRVLDEILTRNAGVEYLQRNGLDFEGSGDIQREEFKKRVPVIAYEELKPYVDRIANGDFSPLLCSTPVSEFLTSSGTSGGERKLMPITEDEQKRREFFCSLMVPIMTQFVPNLDEGKGMYFLFIKSHSDTPSGLVAQPALTSYYKRSLSKGTQNDPYSNKTSPNEAILCLDSFQSMYTQLLCGLFLNLEVTRVGSIFASVLIRVVRFLEKNWVYLCEDIRTGMLNPQITDPSLREAVMKILKPNPGLAGFIEAECKKGSWKGIIPRLWPNTKYIEAIVSGAMAQYVATLEYYGGGVPIASTLYGSSECYSGLNLNPLCKPTDVTYTLIPTMAYFEFLPVCKSDDDGFSDKEPFQNHDSERLVDLVDVKLGHEYELIVTTYTGLYRYRVGDILQVVGFKHKAPQFKFICRKGAVLSIESDKTDEAELQTAIQNAVVTHLSPIGATLTDYTSYADTTTIPGQYVLFFDICQDGANPISPSVFEQCCLTIEESLNSVYRQGRAADKSIGPLEIRVVENGAFDALMDYAISQGASLLQYKAPRCIKEEPLVELMNSQVVSSHFSPKCPKWVPGHKEWQKKIEQSAT